MNTTTTALKVVHRLRDKPAALRFLRTEAGQLNFSTCLFWQAGKPDINSILSSFRVEGEVAEVGVYFGTFALCLAKHFPDKEIHLFDTFEGVPEGVICEHDLSNPNEFHSAGDFNETSVEAVQTLLETHECHNAIFHKGVFPDTASEVEDKKFCFVSIDVDFYKPIKAAFEFFYPRMTKGGTIAVYDDYGNPATPGTKKAVDEFLLDKPESLRLDVADSEALKSLVYIIKE